MFQKAVYVYMHVREARALCTVFGPLVPSLQSLPIPLLVQGLTHHPEINQSVEADCIDGLGFRFPFPYPWWAVVCQSTAWCTKCPPPPKRKGTWSYPLVARMRAAFELSFRVTDAPMELAILL